MIDTSKKNIQSIPLCEENLSNAHFVAGHTEEINEGPDYAIISKVDPKCIIGAMPSESVAFNLGINDKSFIRNPHYQGSVSSEKLKGFSEIAWLYTLHADDKVISEQSCSSSTDSNVVSSTFFHRQPQLPESKSANEHNPYQCER